MTLTPALQRTVDDFQAMEEGDRLQLLLEFADELPELPQRYADHPDLLERVADLPAVHRSTLPGCAGITDAIEHFGFFARV